MMIGSIPSYNYMTNYQAAQEEDTKANGTKVSPEECKTCKNRKYQDGSDEANVSFKSASHVSPESAGAAVRSHEAEHVKNAVCPFIRTSVRSVDVLMYLAEPQTHKLNITTNRIPTSRTRNLQILSTIVGLISIM